MWEKRITLIIMNLLNLLCKYVKFLYINKSSRVYFSQIFYWHIKKHVYAIFLLIKATFLSKCGKIGGNIFIIFTHQLYFIRHSLFKIYIARINR